MRITHCRSVERTRTSVLRSLDDATGERRLIVSTPWRMTEAEVYVAVRDQLTSEEQRELAAALGIGRSGGGS